MNLDGKRVLVIGMGKTGIATTGFLVRKGARVLVADDKPVSELGDGIKPFQGTECVELGISMDNLDILSGTDLIVPSPGIAPFNPLLTEGLRRGIPIVSELELAFEYVKKPIISITGTNGKTTTTALIGEILSHCGKTVFVGGNIGTPLISYVDGGQKEDYIILEVSSFQLQWVRDFRAHVAMLLNVTCDHIDYHGSLEAYRFVKERIFAGQGLGDVAIINSEDPGSYDLVKNLSAEHIISFSSSRPLEKGIFVEGEYLVWRRMGKDESYPISGLKLRGLHNLENVMAAVVASRMCGCDHSGIMEVLNSFTGIGHRIEFSGNVDGVEYFDDSKGTNVDAVYRALQSFPGPVILLVGGRYKGGDFGVLSALLRERCRAVVIFGEAAQRIENMIGGVVKTGCARNLQEALSMARKDALPGDTVLLSPGCSSFDEFRNYEERGTFFKNIVDSMVQRGS